MKRFTQGFQAIETCTFMMRVYSLIWQRRGIAAALLCGVCSSFAQTPRNPQSQAASDRLGRMERRFDREQRQRGDVPPGARQRALDQIQQSNVRSAATPHFGGTYRWFNIGPTPIHDSMGADAAGRVSAIAVDPNDRFHWLLGAAQGGIWESPDGGSTWTARTDDQPSLAMGAIAFAPSNPTIVYAGTGEGNFSGDSYAGMGLLKSTDGGTTWFLVAGQPFALTAFSDIKVHSSDPKVLVAATVRGVMGQVRVRPAHATGIFLSHDGGTNWLQTLSGLATDVEVVRGDFSRQYAALGEIFGDSSNGVYRSTNGGTNWTRINGPWMSAPGPTNIGRIEMALAPFTPDRLYVSVAQSVVGDTGLVGIWRTDNAWAATPTWTQLPDLPALARPDNENFLWYSHDLLVHPDLPDVLYLAAKRTWRFNGTSWQGSVNQHADQHAFAWLPGFDPSSSSVIVANDGGLSSREDSGGGWASHIQGLAISQFYKGAVHPADSSVILGGAQDNGTPAYNGDPGWSKVLGDDGNSCAISAANPGTDWAASHQNASGETIFRSKNGGKMFNTATFGIDSSTVDFFIGFVKHPVNDDVFVAGAINLWRCEDFFSGNVSPTWAMNSPILLTTNGRNAAITAIAFAPSDTLAQTYAYGTEDGQLRLTSNAGGNWANLDPANVIPDRFVTGLVFSPTNSQVLYVTLSGFDEGTPGHTGHVFKTTSALAAVPAWTNVSPPVNLPHDCIAINPLNSQEVYVGSDIGVWQSANGGQSWVHLGPEVGMPNVAVFDLQFDSSGALAAFTHGRGAFIYRRQPVILPPLCAFGPCWPGFLNPGDPVEVYLPLINVLPIQTVDLTVSLRPSSQIIPFNGQQVQSYGALSAAGGTLIRQFKFQVAGGPGPAAGAACGGVVQAMFDLTDAGQSLGTITIPFKVGRLSQPLAQDFEAARLPALPTGWSVQPAGVPGGWTTTTKGPPNVVGGDAPDQVEDDVVRPTGPVSNSAFAPDPASVGDVSLVSPMFMPATTAPHLIFRHSFGLASNFDGAVLEIAIGAQPFTDILQAGGTFTANGYNAILVAGAGPLGGRRAWSGDSGGWVSTEVNLPMNPTGGPMQLRWRIVSSPLGGGEGWYLDDITINEYQCVPPVTNPVLLRPGRYDNLFGFFIDTVPTRTYLLEFKNSLSDTVWQPLQTLNGDGTEQFAADPARGLSQRFYRFRVE